jgi:hypothetical protein
MKYASVKKNGAVFAPLRAAGLCLELALKVAFLKGFHSVQAEELQAVDLHGNDLYVLTDGGAWRKVQAATLDITSEVVEFTLAAYRALLAMMLRVGLNIHAVDKQIPGGNGYHDLVVSWLTTSRILTGLVSVEIKVRNAGRNFSKVVGLIKTEMEARHKTLQSLKSQSSFQGVLLIVIQASKDWRGKWAFSGLIAEVFTGAKWVKLQASARTHRHVKPVVEVLNQVSWHSRRVGRGKVGLVSSFVKAIGKSTQHVGFHALGFNKMLRQHGSRTLSKLKLKFKPGSPAWVGDRPTLKQLYRLIIRSQ